MRLKVQEERPVKCDGNHGGPRCADPECWNDMPQAQEETPDLITLEKALAAIDELAFQMTSIATPEDTHPNIGAIREWVQQIRVLSALRGSPPAPAERPAIAQVLQRLEAYGLPAPTMCLEENGEIGLDWHERRAASLSLNVSDDGYVGWSVLIDDWSTFGRWRVAEWPDELDKLLKRFAADAKAQPSDRTGAPTWQPIASAPKDGSAVLGYGLHSGPQPDAQRGVKAGDHWWAIMLWDIWRNPDAAGWGEQSLWVFAKDGKPTWSRPTHWMPMPLPPAPSPASTREEK